MSTAGVTLGTDITVLRVMEVFTVGEGSFRAINHGGTSARGRANVTSRAEVSLVSRHACVRTVMLGWALVQGRKTWQAGKRRVVADRRYSGCLRSLGAVVSRRAR